MRPGATFALLVAACGSGTAAAPIDAPATIDATCPPPPGRAYVMDSLIMLPAGDGFDLDGDGDLDNAIGNAPTAALDAANTGLAGSISTGEFLMIYQVVRWDEPLSPDDPDVSLSAFQVYDADMPPDPSNNYGGAGQFLIALNQLDLSCQSKTEADQASMAGGVLTATNDVWRFTFLSGLGAFEFRNATFVVEFSPDLRTAVGRLGATTTLCSLSDLNYPGSTNGTVLDAFINDPTIRDVVQVDIDADGDGFERVEGDGVTVLRCIDGDGTIIEGADCPCHPAIVDGYSLGAQCGMVLAEVVGTI